MNNEHATWAPSSAARWLACPPSATLSQGLPETTNPAALEGTRVHGVVERALRTGEIPPPLAPWLPPSKNMSDRDVAILARSYLDQLGAGMILIEERVLLAKGCWGRLDLGHAAASIVTIFDFKNGAWNVEAKDNKQLLTYAATFLQHYPEVQHFRLVVFQPNSWGSDEAFKQHVHTRQEVEAHRQLVLSAMEYTGPPLPGPHCRWCPAFSRCPAMSQDANFLMGAIARNPEMLLPIEILRMLRVIRSLEDMRKHLESVLTERLKTGAVVDGATLKPSTKWTAWNDDRQAAETLYKLHGAKGVKAITPSAAKKLSPDAASYVAIASHKPEPEIKASY